MRHLYDMVDQAVGRAVGQLASAIYSVARFTYMAKSSANGVSDTVEGQPLAPDENGGTGTSQEEVRRLGGTWGVWGVIPKGEPCLVVRAGGGGTNGVIVAAGGERYSPASMNDGEVALYNKVTGCTILLDEDGKITITAASGQDVVVNAGTKKVARVDDTAKAATLMATWQTQVETAITNLGGTTPSPAASTFNTTSIAVINTGATHFKG